jgi:GNAT superfamily N-acetyltransferase
MATVRDLRAQDKPRWLELWGAYTRFYETDVAEEVTEHTWQRLLDPGFPVLGRAAEVHGRIAGFTVAVLHEGSWTSTPICYLEDLFVDPDARGAGIGRALIQDLIDLGRVRGWSRLYWHTKADNATARRLYDRFAQADGFVRYRLFLDEAP